MSRSLRVVSVFLCLVFSLATTAGLNERCMRIRERCMHKKIVLEGIRIAITEGRRDVVNPPCSGEGGNCRG